MPQRSNAARSIAMMVAYVVSLLRAWYGDAASKENNWGFEWLPRVTGDHSEFGFWLDMADGKVEGLFVMGQNPAVGAPNGRLERKALANLKWLVVRDMVETETASFWKDSPEVERGELDPKSIATEVFLFPAAGQGEKSGTFTNTQRLLQYHNKAVDPPGDARSETWFMYHLGRRLKAMAAQDALPRNDGLRALTWNYSTHGAHAEPNVEEILQEINGYMVADRKLLENFHKLTNDGSTACGCWIYSGVMPHSGENKANKREPKGLLGHGWGFAWPNDTRILYNRASARPDGKPWSERKALVWWDPEKNEWTGDDTPDFQKNKAPDHKGDVHHGEGPEALPGDKPFIVHPDGMGWLYVTSGLKDGPLSSTTNRWKPTSAIRFTPNSTTRRQRRKSGRNPYAFLGDARFPYVLTTYRLTEHHTAGGMSRGCGPPANLRWALTRRRA